MPSNPLVTKAGLAITSNLVSGLGGTVPKFCAHGTGAVAPAYADTVLGAEVDSRATGTPTRVTVTDTNDTLQVVGTITSGGSHAITESGLFDQSALGGNMMARGTYAALNLVINDTQTDTWKITWTGG